MVLYLLLMASFKWVMLLMRWFPYFLKAFSGKYNIFFVNLHIVLYTFLLSQWILLIKILILYFEGLNLLLFLLQILLINMPTHYFILKLISLLILNYIRRCPTCICWMTSVIFNLLKILIYHFICIFFFNYMIITFWFFYF